MFKKLILFFLSLLFGLWTSSANAQFSVQIDTTNFTICGGSTVSLTASFTGIANYTLQNDFNNGVIGAGWYSTQANPVFNNPCGVGPNGAHLWVGTTPSQMRTLVTNSYDFSHATDVTVSFWMRYGIIPSSGNCEDPDWQDEGIHLQWTTDNGTFWTDFPGPDLEPVGNLNTNPPYTTTTPGSGGYWEPHSSHAQQEQSELYFWNKYECQLPASALDTNVKLRWAQLATSNAGFDAWGIDEVEIEVNSTAMPSQLLWTGKQNGATASFYFPEKASAYDTTVVVYLASDASLADSITISVVPKPDASLLHTVDTICTTAPIQFINSFTDNPNYSYTWYVDQQMASEKSAWLDTFFTQTGNHQVTLKIDNGYCLNESTHSFYVKPGFQMPAYSVNPQHNCGPTQVDFSINPSSYLVAWQLTPQLYSTQDNISYNYNQAGIYHPRMTVTNPATACQASIIFDIRIGDEPQTNFTVSPQNLTLFNSTAQFNDQSFTPDTIQTIVDWDWDFGDGFYSNVQNPSHNYSTIGNYKPKLTITTDLGCQDTSSLNITVVTSISELEESGLKVYPNPADEFFTIESDNQLPEQISIFDASGKLIEKIRISEDKQQRINIRHLSAGMYFLDMQVGKEILRYKIIKS